MRDDGETATSPYGCRRRSQLAPEGLELQGRAVPAQRPCATRTRKKSTSNGFCTKSRTPTLSLRPRRPQSDSHGCGEHGRGRPVSSRSRSSLSRSRSWPGRQWSGDRVQVRFRLPSTVKVAFRRPARHWISRSFGRETSAKRLGPGRGVLEDEEAMIVSFARGSCSRSAPGSKDGRWRPFARLAVRPGSLHAVYPRDLRTDQPDQASAASIDARNEPGSDAKYLLSAIESCPAPIDYGHLRSCADAQSARAEGVWSRRTTSMLSAACACGPESELTAAIPHTVVPGRSCWRTGRVLAGQTRLRKSPRTRTIENRQTPPALVRSYDSVTSSRLHRELAAVGAWQSGRVHLPGEPSRCDGIQGLHSWTAPQCDSKTSSPTVTPAAWMDPEVGRKLE